MKLVLSWVILPVFCLAGCMPHPPAMLVADPPLYSPPERNSVSFWGHACCYIDLEGLGIVTDPVFDDSYSPWHRRQIPAPAPLAYARTRIILISHAHRDHFSRKTLATFPQNVTILCSAPTAKRLTKLNRQVRVMKPGESYGFPGGTIMAVPAHHPGGRNSVKAGADGRALGFVIRTPEVTIYYSGDTKYFRGMKDIGDTYHPDLAILNINTHLNSSEAVRAVWALGVSKVLPMHYGAYSGPSARKCLSWLTELQGLLGRIFVPLRVGESFDLPIRHNAASGNILERDTRMPGRDCRVPNAGPTTHKIHLDLQNSAFFV